MKNIREIFESNFGIIEYTRSMTLEIRKDNKNRVLKDGEYQITNGTFEYKWRDKIGKRHSIYAKTLDSVIHQVLDLGVEDEYLRYNPSG